MKDDNGKIINQKISSEWDEGIFIVLFLMIVLIPIVFYPYCIPVFNPAKDLLFQILTLVALTLLALKLISSEGIFWIKTQLDKPILIYLIFGSLSIIWSVNIYHSILTLPLFLAGPLLYYIVTQSILEQKLIDRLLFIIIFVGTVMGAYGIFQYFGIDFEFWKGNIGRNQVFGLFGNVNYFAEFMIFPLSLTIGLILSKEKPFNRYFLLSCLIIMSGALFLTFTRGSYLAIVLSIPLILLCYIRGSKEKRDKDFYTKIILYFLILVILGTVIIFIPHPLNQGNSPLAKLKSRVSTEALTSGSSLLRRIATWKFTWMMIEDYPLLGSGLGTYDFITLKYQADFFAQDKNRDIYPHGFAAQAHNEYLQLWAELGIIGLLFFLGIIFVYYRNLFKYFKILEGKQKTISISLAGGITAVLIDATFGFPLQLAASLFLFWLFIGLTSAQIALAHKTHMVSDIKNIKKAQNSIKYDRDSNTPVSIVIKKAILSFLAVFIMVVLILFLVRPFVSRVYWYYGTQQIIKEKINDAIKTYEKGLKWNPWQGEMYYDIGNILATKGINNLALEYLHKAGKYVDHHNLPQNIANLYIKLNDINKAIPYLEQAIKYQQSKEKMLPLQLQLGNLFLKVKEYQKAEQVFDAIIANYPESAEAYYGIAGAYTYQGKKEQTIKALQKVIELAPESNLAGYAKVMLKKIEISEKE